MFGDFFVISLDLTMFSLFHHWILMEAISRKWTKETNDVFVIGNLMLLLLLLLYYGDQLNPKH